MGAGTEPELVTEGSQVLILADGVTVGRAAVAVGPTEPGPHAVDLEVETSWQRRGVGTGLLGAAARQAVGMGAQEIVLATRADNQAVMSMLLAAG